MLYNEKDVNLKQAQSFFIGFIIAGGIIAFFFLVLGVNAQLADTYIPPTKTTQIITATGTESVMIPLKITEMTVKDLTAYETHLNQLKQDTDNLASKYAKLYDACKNK